MHDTMYAIPPARFEDVEVATRLLIVTDISVFWDGDRPHWTSDKLWDILSWSDIEDGTEFWDRLIVIARDYPLAAYRDNPSFRSAWNTWANQMSYNLWVDLTMHHVTGGDATLDQFGMADADFKAHCRFYTKEFFDRYPNDAIGAAMTDTLLGFNLHPQPTIFAPYRADDLAGYFARGEITVETDAINDGSDDIQEVYFLGRCDGNVSVDAFQVPRSYVS
jgi:hypothetical protein